jgi:protein translocase SecG subunit
LETFLYIVFFISCIVLIASVLLQPGKTDAGALFTSGVSSASLNPRGTASVLSKLTIAAVTIFMLTALLLSLPALTGNVSVLQTQGESNTSTNTNANANANSNANANAQNTNTANAANSSATNTESNSTANQEPKKEEPKAVEKTEPKADETKDSGKDKPAEKK